jgi:phosphoribosylanthranilate isomerase
MKDLSNQAARWWFLTTTQAKCYYEEWKEATPLQRVQIHQGLPEELHASTYARTEQRGVHLMLKAVSANQQQELVVDRDLNSTAILFRLYVRHQPGGPAEKGILLRNLTTMPSCKSAMEWTAGAGTMEERGRSGRFCLMDAS